MSSQMLSVGVPDGMQMIETYYLTMSDQLTDAAAAGSQ
jgi:hypothetical protein